MYQIKMNDGAADEELAGDQKAARSRRSVARISARPRAKAWLRGVCETCDERARILAVLYSTFPAQFNAEKEIRIACEGGRWPGS